GMTAPAVDGCECGGAVAGAPIAATLQRAARSRFPARRWPISRVTSAPLAAAEATPERSLARRHARGAVEPDARTVQPDVFADVDGERGVFVGLAEARGKRDGCGERLLRVIGKA